MMYTFHECHVHRTNISIKITLAQVLGLYIYLKQNYYTIVSNENLVQQARSPFTNLIDGECSTCIQYAQRWKQRILIKFNLT